MYVYSKTSTEAVENDDMNTNENEIWKMKRYTCRIIFSQTIYIFFYNFFFSNNANNENKRIIMCNHSNFNTKGKQYTNTEEHTHTTIVLTLVNVYTYTL